LKQNEMIPRFDAFGDRLEPKLAGQRDNGSNDLCIRAATVHILHE